MLKEQLKEVERRIQAACDRAGRKREEVTSDRCKQNKACINDSKRAYQSWYTCIR